MIKKRLRRHVIILDKRMGDYRLKDYIWLALLTHVPDKNIRGRMALILCDGKTLFPELLLLRLTFDMSQMVRLEATDSLCMGKTKLSLRRLYLLSRGKDRYFRAYAFMSLLDVVDRRGREKEQKKYYKYICGQMETEKSRMVKFMVEAQLYMRGEEKYIRDISRMIANEIRHGLQEFHFIVFMNVLDEILNDSNKEQIKRIVARLEKEVDFEKLYKRAEGELRWEKISVQQK